MAPLQMQSNYNTMITESRGYLGSIKQDKNQPYKTSVLAKYGQGHQEPGQHP